MESLWSGLSLAFPEWKVRGPVYRSLSQNEKFMVRFTARFLGIKILLSRLLPFFPHPLNEIFPLASLSLWKRGPMSKNNLKAKG
jgi:hypothetical protein